MKNDERLELAEQLADIPYRLEAWVKSLDIKLNSFDYISMKHLIYNIKHTVNSANSIILPRGYKIVVSEPVVNLRIRGQ